MTQDGAAGRAPARRGASRGHGREQRHRRRHRRGVRRRGRDGARDPPGQRGGGVRGRRADRPPRWPRLVAQADLGTRAGCEALVAQARERLGGLDVWVNNAGADVLTGEAAELGLGAQARPPARGRPQGDRRVLLRRRRRDARAARRRDDREHELGPRRPREWPARTPSCSAPSRAACSPSARAWRAAWRPGSASTCSARAGSRPRSRGEADRDFHRSVAESTPLGRWGRPEDVAAAALWLASPEAAFVTGQAVNINGGVVM